MKNNPGEAIQQQQSKADTIYITYYTDPLCCWSWAMEPALQKIKAEFAEQINWRYCMGGLIPSWENFSDPVNSVTRPFQMGPVWMHASSVSGVAIDHNLWFRNPPASSYPACIAFKCAELQSEEYAVAYLRLLREGCMINGIDISRQEELVQLSRTLKESYPGFNTELFKEHLIKGKGRDAFRADIREIKANNINRFPSMILRQQGKSSLLITGYRPYESLLDVINQLVTGITDNKD